MSSNSEPLSQFREHCLTVAYLSSEGIMSKTEFKSAVLKAIANLREGPFNLRSYCEDLKWACTNAYITEDQLKSETAKGVEKSVTALKGSSSVTTVTTSSIVSTSSSLSSSSSSSSFSSLSTSSASSSLAGPLDNVEEKFYLCYRIIGAETKDNVKVLRGLVPDVHGLADVKNALAKAENLNLIKDQKAIDLFSIGGHALQLTTSTQKKSLEDMLFKSGDLIFACVRNALTADATMPSTVTLVHSWQSLYSAADLEPSFVCTKKGLCAFFASLYTVMHHLPRSSWGKFLGFLRSQLNYQPAVHALYSLLKGESLHASYRYVLVEALFPLFRSYAPLKVPVNQVLEHSATIWTQIIADSNLKSVKPVELPTEVTAVCPITLKRALDPVRIAPKKDRDIYSKKALMTKITKKEKYLSLTLEEKDLVPDAFVTRMNATLNDSSSIDSFFEWDYDVLRDEGDSEQKIIPTIKDIIRSFPNLESRALAGTDTKWTTMVRAATQVAYLKTVPTLSLKSLGLKLPVLTLDSKGQLCVFYGRGKGSENQVELFLPLSSTCKEYSADQLAVKTASFFDDDATSEDTREPDEATLVLLDKSGSMCGRFGDMTRMDTVKQFFHAYSNRCMAYNLAQQIGLIVFGDIASVECRMTPLFERFKEVIDSTKPGGRTALWDAVNLALSQLLIFQKKHPKCQLRILVLSDGENTCSKATSIPLIDKCQKANVVVDSVVIGPACDIELKCMSKVTGGLCLNPASAQEGYKVFEYETVLSLKERAQTSENPYIGRKIKTEDDWKKFTWIPFCQPPLRPFPKAINNPVKSISSTIRIAEEQSSTSSTNAAQIRRIIAELKFLQKNPHPYVKVFPNAANVNFWRILLEGPETTPYEGGIFCLYASFPQNYPNEPPEVRFVTPIYHCNINKSGKICHSVLGRDYNSAIKMKDVLSCIYGLLLTPEPLDPLDSVTASEYLSDRKTYNANAIKLTEQVAKVKTLKQWKKEILGRDYEEEEEEEKREAEEEAKKKKEASSTATSSASSSSLSTTTTTSSTSTSSSSLSTDEKEKKIVKKPAEVPQDLICPITMEIFSDPVLAPSGKTYERAAILDCIQRTNADPFSGKLLSEKMLKPNDKVKAAVDKWKKDNGLNF
eukprot:TRINITY_DN329_c0_g2_i1.p1 TRINITY_DN329_c0_g2~~TRINITY_DN329_c0_g2_i1.p1  ORF type:complete len:1132 (+),score=310.68 TRINITY_DN329_c0_g2_i1:61-3456(+)